MVRSLRRRNEWGVTLAELVIVGSVVAAVVLLALPVAKQAAQWRSQRRLSRAAAVLFEALEAYHSDRGSFPPPGANQPDGFNLRTLEPLSTHGYLRRPQELLSLLRGRRVSAYDSDEDGFWLLLVDAHRPEIQIVVASTDRFPLQPESWIEGIYRLEGSRLVRLRAEPAGPLAVAAGLPARGASGG
ncbi:MAG: hypothetical protein D6718_08840 [Acidobacteria bacterium]|nr:MAG: hypothetical protein D6718_08840 [Acidobacteriota bacterium]